MGPDPKAQSVARVAAEVWCIGFLTCLDDRAADAAGSLKHIEQFVAVAPADGPLQG